MINKNEQSYRRLFVWQKSNLLALEIYKITRSFPRHELFALVSQMRRSSVSVPANIAEGYAYQSKKEKRRYYQIAKGSLTELEYYIDFSLELGYITSKQHQLLIVLREETGKILNGLIKSTS